MCKDYKQADRLVFFQFLSFSQTMLHLPLSLHDFTHVSLTLGLPRGGWLPLTPFVFLHHAIDLYGI